MARLLAGFGAALLLAAVLATAAGCGGDGREAEVATSPAETGGAAPELPPLAASVADTWRATVVGEGIKPALELDGSGSPAVAFIREDFMGEVAFAAAEGGWQEQVISKGYFYGPLDLAFDSEGRPNIVYHDHEDTELNPRAGNLAFAVREGSEWQVETLRNQGHDGWDSAIAVGDDGVVHAAGIDPAQFRSEDGVEYYRQDEQGSWTVTSIGSGPLVYEFNVGLALHPDGFPAVTYYDDAEGDLVFAAFDGNEWKLETVVAKGDAGKFSSLAFDAEGRPHVTFFQQASAGTGTIRYAVQTGGGWAVEDVGTLEDVELGMEGARRNSSLALDAQGVPHVAFSDRGVLRYAVRADGGWEVEDVASAADRALGQLVDLELDDAGTPHLASYEVTGSGPLTGLVVYLTPSS